MGPRGDVILQLDWTVGEIMQTLDRLHLAGNTILLFTSDNGPVVDDGYPDEAVAKLGGHTPAGPLRGGKYSAFDGGTRVPFIIRWPGRIPAHSVSDAPVSQIDLYATFARLTGQQPATTDAPDSRDMLDVLLGKSNTGREVIIEQSLNNTLSIIRDGWKYIEPSNDQPVQLTTHTELGNDPKPQLYNMKTDKGEKKNVADAHPAMVKKLEALLKEIKREK